MPRSATDRARLQRLIRLVDRVFPDGGNCYRRSLLEIALDSTASKETLYMGLKQHGALNSGHAWLESEGSPRESYDARFVA